MNNKEIQLFEPKLTISSAAAFLNVTAQAVHKQLKAKGLICPKLGNKSYINHEIANKLFNLYFTTKVIVGQIVKGGTGKTTTIDSLASCANSFGARVLKVDIDPQGNLTDIHNIDADNHPVIIDVIKDNIPIEDCIIKISNGMDLIPSRIENVILDNVLVNDRLPLDKFFEDLLAPVRDQYDFIFIDCPPTMGQAVTAASLYADIIIAPLNPDKFSSKGLHILRNEIERLNKLYRKQIDYKVFLNKFSGKTILSDKTIVSLISDPLLEGHVMGTTVQLSQEVPNLTNEDRNLFSNLKNLSVRDDFNLLTLELLNIHANVGNTTNSSSSINQVELA